MKKMIILTKENYYMTIQYYILQMKKNLSKNINFNLKYSKLVFYLLEIFSSPIKFILYFDLIL